MANHELTDRDLEWLTECYTDAMRECRAEGWDYEGEPVMTSIGYVDLDRDGDVYAHGKKVGSVDEAGQ